MTEYIGLLFGAVFINNMVLVQFLGLCPFMGASNQFRGALGLAAATSFVLATACVLTYGVYHWLLEPLELSYLRTMAFILIIASLVNFTETTIKSQSPLLQKVLGQYLPLITSNCAILGVSLININRNHDLIASFCYGIGAALGFALVLIMFTEFKTRLNESMIPKPFRGQAIHMISAGLISLAFMGFIGMDG